MVRSPAPAFRSISAEPGEISTSCFVTEAVLLETEPDFEVVSISAAGLDFPIGFVLPAGAVELVGVVSVEDAASSEDSNRTVSVDLAVSSSAKTDIIELLVIKSMKAANRQNILFLCLAIVASLLCIVI